MFNINIENETIKNTNYRKVLYTSDNMQLVVMSLNKGESISPEIHKFSDQFFRIEKGECLIVTTSSKQILKSGDVAIIKHGIKHTVVNTGRTRLKLYTIYSPPHHPPNTIQKFKSY